MSASLPCGHIVTILKKLGYSPRERERGRGRERERGKEGEREREGEKGVYIIYSGQYHR